MPRFNVEYNNKWACFSSIADGFVTRFESKESYEEWRKEEYKENYKPLEMCNIMELKECIERMLLDSKLVDVVANLVDVGVEVYHISKVLNDIYHEGKMS